MENNVLFAKDACRYCVAQGHIPYAPHLLLTQILDDSDPAQRETGLRMGLEMLERCDELWVFGDRISRGMEGEIRHARALGIPVRPVGEVEITAILSQERAAVGQQML